MKLNIFKRLAVGLLAASAAVALPLSASAAWVNNGGAWQWTENGVPATGWRWISGDGAWYHFNASGDMTTGWIQDGGSWYYLKPNGAMARFWNQINGKWYFMNTSGAMQTGWVMARNVWYFLGPDGVMIADTVAQIDGETYCFDETGALVIGKVEIDGKTYTFDEDGQAVGKAPEADVAYTTDTGAVVEVAVVVPKTTSTGGSYTGGGSSSGDTDDEDKPDPEIEVQNPESLVNLITSWYQYESTYYLDTEVQIDFDKIPIDSIVSIKFELFKDDTLMGSALSTDTNLKTLLDDCKQYWPEEIAGKQWLSCAFTHRETENDNGYWVYSAYTGSESDEQPNKLIVTIVTNDGYKYVSTSSHTVTAITGDTESSTDEEIEGSGQEPSGTEGDGAGDGTEGGSGQGTDSTGGTGTGDGTNGTGTGEGQESGTGSANTSTEGEGGGETA